MQTTKKPNPSEETGSPSVHIGKVCANPPGKDLPANRNSEFVDIVIDAKGDLSLVRLEHLANPQAPHPHFLPIVTFPEGFHLPDGMTLRVHMGAGKRGQEDNHTYHWYAAGEQGQGHYRLNNTGDIVRVVDRHGHELARRQLSGKECEDKPRGPHIIVPPPIVPVRSYGGSK